MDSLNENNPATHIDILLAKYIIGEADADQTSEVMQWMALSESNKKHVEQLQTIWSKSARLAFNHELDPLPAWQKFLTRTTAKPPIQSLRKLFWRRWIPAAAIVLIAGISSAIFIWRPNKQDSPVMLNVSSGDRNRTDTLPDGSIVILKPNSSLTWPSAFPSNQRSISLEGDASLMVTHDPKRPFNVSVSDITVTVLGTSFDIASSSGRMEITVKSGMVSITGRGQRQTLHANEKLVVPTKDSIWIKQADTFVNTNLQKETRPDVTPLQSKPIKQLAYKSTHALMVGDVAPILPLDKWIKGAPINVYDRGKVYLVDFWAVWCGPCIAGMGRLSELQKKYEKQGLEVMSVTSEDEWGNSYEKVIRFIDSNANRFDYHFAWLPQSYRADHKYRSIIYNHWLELAYDSSSWALPQIFLIDRNGKFAFIGDGYNLEEDFIKRVLDNNYDTAEERKNYIEKLTLESGAAEFLTLLEAKNIPAAISLGHSIVGNPLVTSHTLMVISEKVFYKNEGVQSKELLQLGLEAAKKGVTITGSHSPGHLAVLAKGYSLLNQPEQAVKITKSAIVLAEGDYKVALGKDLKEYEQMVKNK